MKDKYNAACSRALAGDRNKAFAFLRSVIAVDQWSNLLRITSDADLESLHNDPHWVPLMEVVKLNNLAEEVKLNQPLVSLLNTIYNDDQLRRRNLNQFEKQTGAGCRQMESLWKQIGFYDSSNLIKVRKIIDTDGWLGPDRVGQRGATTIFLVILHADSLTQVTYFSAMRDAEKEGKARASDLALLEDSYLQDRVSHHFMAAC